MKKVGFLLEGEEPEEICGKGEEDERLGESERGYWSGIAGKGETDGLDFL